MQSAKNIFTTVWILFAFNSNLFSQSHSWTLEKCISYATEHNITVLRGKLSEALAKAQFEQTRKSIYPSATLSSYLADQSGRSLDPTTYTFTVRQLLSQQNNISGSMPIFNFGKLKNAVESEKYNYYAAQWDVNKLIDASIAQVISGYFQVLLSGAEILVKKSIATQTSNQRDITQKLAALGKIPGINVIQTDSKLLNDSVEIENAQLQFYKSVFALKAMLSIPDSAEVFFNDSTIEYFDVSTILNLTPDAIYSNALENRAAQKSNRMKIESAKINIKVARTKWLPDLSLSYSIASSFSNYISHQSFGKWWKGYSMQLANNFNQQVALQLTVPILNTGQRKLAITQAKLALKDAELLSLQDNIEINKEIHSSYQECKVLLEKKRYLNQLVQNLEKNYDAMLKGYQIGAVKLLDLLESQNELSRVRLSKINLDYSLIFKTLILQLYSGIPITMLNPKRS